MPRFTHLPKTSRYRCRGCAKSDYGNYFISKTLCKKCAAGRRNSGPIHNVHLSNDLTITKYVDARLRTSAEADLRKTLAPPALDYSGAKIAIFVTLVCCWALGIIYGVSDAPKPSNLEIRWAIGLAWLFLPFIPAFLIGEAISRPQQEEWRRQQAMWEGEVHSRVLVLAHNREQRIRETELFYSTPEWKALRAKVIQEEGRYCSDCGSMIDKDVDLTVDHILPRSKHPELALRRDNLQVLCRSCNSAKGDRYY